VPRIAAIDIPHPSGLPGRQVYYRLSNGIDVLTVVGFPGNDGEPGSDGIELHAGFFDGEVSVECWGPDTRIAREIKCATSAEVDSVLDRLEALPQQRFVP
jgi:hypothetical protein